MEKNNENLQRALSDFEISESLTTPLVPFKFNIVHDYLNDKTLPQRPSLPPKFLENLIPKPIILSRQTFSINYKTDSKEKEEKKEVRFENNDEIKEKENPQILASLNVINNDEIKKNNIEIPDEEEIREDLLKPRRNKEKKHKTVIIPAENSEQEKILEQEKDLEQEKINDETKSPEKEKRIKSHTFSSPEKNTKASRNSKLLAFSKIVDPLDKIDQENQRNLDLQANQEKLIFYNEDNKDEQHKYLTFSKAKLEDFKAKMHEQDLQFGKFTCITVNIFHQFYYLHLKKKGITKLYYSWNTIRIYLCVQSFEKLLKNHSFFL